MISPNAALQYKIVLIGDAGVGKTQMLAAFTRAGDDVQTRPTIGVEFGTKVVDLPDGSQCKAQIWDTAGQERYRAITSSHYRRAQGALVVFDVTAPKSFSNATSLWLRELKEATSPDSGTHECIVLCGNKVDLVEEGEAPAVTAEAHEAAAAEHELLLSRTSAITGENIKEAFEKLVHSASLAARAPAPASTPPLARSRARSRQPAVAHPSSRASFFCLDRMHTPRRTTRRRPSQRCTRCSSCSSATSLRRRRLIKPSI